jgi:hypothetical protein
VQRGPASSTAHAAYRRSCCRCLLTLPRRFRRAAGVEPSPPLAAAHPAAASAAHITSGSTSIASCRARLLFHSTRDAVAAVGVMEGLEQQQPSSPSAGWIAKRWSWPASQGPEQQHSHEASLSRQPPPHERRVAGCFTAGEWGLTPCVSCDACWCCCTLLPWLTRRVFAPPLPAYLPVNR